MKKYIPYTFILILVTGVILLFVTGSNKSKRRLNERITLRKQDKIPYGLYAAYHDLSYIFPGASIYTSRHEPGYWDSLSNYDSKQAFIAITDKFTANQDEMRRLITFAEHGNDVFISAIYLSAAADDIFGCESSSYGLSAVSIDDLKDKMHISLTDPPFGKNSQYDYPGKTFGSYFSSIDSSTTDILGYDEAGKPDFIHLRAGRGHFYIQLEPLAFSNYFLLHKNNISYYEKALSVIQPGVQKVLWDEYYRYKRSDTENNEKKKNWLSVLFQYPALKAALLTAIFTLIIYILMEMRRKQRYIPVIKSPRNDSLDFVRTIGRLYYDKGDHRNLVRKMAAYFLEHVRNKYKLQTSTLDESFIKSLQYKSGAAEQDIRGIISFIKYVEDAPVINYKQLTDFHKELESFYQKT